MGGQQDGHILVTFQAVADAAQDTDDINGQIGATLDQLHQYLNPLVATWTGRAADDYTTLQRQWDDAAGQLNDILHSVANALRTAHENYTAAESTNSSIWTGSGR